MTAIPQDAAYVQVRGLNANGKAIGSSRTLKVR